MAVETRRLLTTSKAISEAIAQEMERDPSVFVMGEDVGVYGGIFGATEGLLGKFGPARIMDTPISETAFIGAAIGAAISGLRPHGPDLQPYGEDPLRVGWQRQGPDGAHHRHRGWVR
jgi:pyruvate dehydrogenase E1 component beta subunit